MTAHPLSQLAIQQALGRLGNNEKVFLKLLGDLLSAAAEGHVDMQQVFSDLKGAIAAFDPGAVDFVDRLLAAAPPSGQLFETLSRAREHLTQGIVLSGGEAGI
ncbi:MAG: hypothetical protein ACNA7W_13615 [Pseudomonadales bacterium]